MKILVLLLVSMSAIAEDYEESRKFERELKEYQEQLKQKQKDERESRIIGQKITLEREYESQKKANEEVEAQRWRPSCC